MIDLSTSVPLSLYDPETIPDSTFNACFHLVEKNLKQMYLPVAAR
jgi:hypothetical protein